jgi:putative OPT family oligopeptide transporter
MAKEKKTTEEYREVTVAAVLLGLVQGILMTTAFVYSGLKLGFTLGGSTVAAIMGFTVLKGVMGKGTIVENNINQTIASGINIAGSGVIFTLPVLFMMGMKDDFNPLYMCIAAVAGSFLGIAVIIPLRKQMIDFDRLRFPSGTAVCAILKSPGAGMGKALLLGGGFLISVITVVCVHSNFLPSVIPIGDWFGFPAYTQTGIAVSTMNLGAGLLSGLGGLPFALGGVLAFWVCAPVAVKMGWAFITPSAIEAAEKASSAAAATAVKAAATAAEAASIVAEPVRVDLMLQGHVYADMLRPLGIGMLIGGALMGVIMSYPMMKEALKSLSNVPISEDGEDSSDEMPAHFIYMGIATAAVVFFLAAYLGTEGISVGKACLISFFGTCYLAVAGIIVAECTGATDISPLSGLALICVTVIMFLTSNNVIAAVLIGMAVCVATAQCADMMQDLKTGYLVGSYPIRQQTVQLAVAWIGPLIAIATTYFLWYTPSGQPGFGPGTPLIAPQAQALKAMVEGLMNGTVPYLKYGCGALLGGALTLLPVGGLGVLVGLAMYLPFDITLGYGIGCLFSMALVKKYSSGWVEDKLVPFAAGLIVGEALTELSYSIAAMM